MGGRKRKSLYARTVHALQAVIAGELERGRALPLEVGALTVQGAGGPPAHRQYGPTISLEVAGRVYTATRTMLRGRILWLVPAQVESFDVSARETYLGNTTPRPQLGTIEFELKAGPEVRQFFDDLGAKLRRPRPEPRRCPNGAWTVQGRRYRSRWLALASVRSPAEEMFMLGTEKLGRRLAGALNRNAKRKIEARDAAGRPYTLELIDDFMLALGSLVSTVSSSRSVRSQEGADHAAS